MLLCAFAAIHGTLDLDTPWQTVAEPLPETGGVPKHSADVLAELPSDNDGAGAAAQWVAGGAHGSSPPAGGNTGAPHVRRHPHVSRPPKEVS